MCSKPYRARGGLRETDFKSQKVKLAKKQFIIRLLCGLLIYFVIYCIGVAINVGCWY